MTAQTTTATRRIPPWLAPAAAALVLVVAIAAVILLARRSAAPDVPPQPPAFQAPVIEAAPTLDVQQVVGGRLHLSDGSRDVEIQPSARVERLAVEQVANIRPGDWLTVIGIPNEVKNFSIRSIVLLAPAGGMDADHVSRSAAGFAGHEATRDGRERPVMGGVVERVDGSVVSIRGPGGLIAVDIGPNAPVRRLETFRAAEIREGDLIAYLPPAGGLPAATSVLVLPGGAR